MLRFLAILILTAAIITMLTGQSMARVASVATNGPALTASAVIGRVVPVWTHEE